VKEMLGHMVRKRKGAPVITDVFLDHSTYDRFRAYIAKNGFDESEALVNVLERGMANYWLQEFKQLKQGYLPMEKLFKEYEKDNQLLKALEQENEQLKKILEDEQRRKRKQLHSSHQIHEGRT